MLSNIWYWLKGLFSVINKVEPVIDKVQQEFNEIVDEVQKVSKRVDKE